MRRITFVLVLVLVLSLAAASVVAAGSLFTDALRGLEVWPGTQTINPTTQTYSTTDILFAGIARGSANGSFGISANITGALAPSGLPVVCASLVTVTGGSWILSTRQGRVGGKITGGQLAYRPDGPVFGRCLGPVSATWRSR
jgi:hypothetical protein